MEKPITLQIEELKKNIADTINAAKLPPFLLEHIMKDLYNETCVLSRSQLAQDRKAYEQSLNEDKHQKNVSCN